MLNCWRNIKICTYLLDAELAQVAKILPHGWQEDNSCWWPGDPKKEVTSNYGIDLVFVENSSLYTVSRSPVRCHSYLPPDFPSSVRASNRLFQLYIEETRLMMLHWGQDTQGMQTVNHHTPAWNLEFTSPHRRLRLWWQQYIYGLAQERRNSSALAMELRLSYTDLSIWRCWIKNITNCLLFFNSLLHIYMGFSSIIIHCFVVHHKNMLYKCKYMVKFIRHRSFGCCCIGCHRWLNLI